MPSVIEQHDSSAAAAARGVQSAPPASTTSLACDTVRLDGDDAPRALCSADLINTGETFESMVLLSSVETALTGKLCTV